MQQVELLSYEMADAAKYSIVQRIQESTSLPRCGRPDS